MKKLFNKIFISLITVSIVLSNTVLAETNMIAKFKDYLLNNFSINIDSKQYILDKDKTFEDEINILISESMNNIEEYSEEKSQEAEENLIAYGNTVKEDIYRQIEEIKNNILNSYEESSSNTIIENNYDHTIETEYINE